MLCKLQLPTIHILVGGQKKILGVAERSSHVVGCRRNELSARKLQFWCTPQFFPIGIGIQFDFDWIIFLRHA